MMIKINTLVKSGIQTRVSLDEETIANYRDLILEGTAFPPVTVYRLSDGTEPNQLLLVDGFHRVSAALEAGKNEIDADIIGGTYREALLAALKANSAHGLHRSNADKKNSMELAFANWNLLMKEQAQEGADTSKMLPTSRSLAAICGVSDRCAAYFLADKAKVCNLHTPPSDEEDSPAKKKAVSMQLSRGKDRFGMEIPEEIRPAFEVGEFNETLRLIKKLEATMTEHLDQGKPAYMAVGRMILIDIANVHRRFKSSQAYCVCRYCRGSKCYRCNQRGFLTKLQYKSLPSEMKAEEE